MNIKFNKIITTSLSLLISQKTEKFRDSCIESLQGDFEKKSEILDYYPNLQNLFELCGAKFLVTSHSIIRSLSPKIGQLWGEVADISPYIIKPKFEFGVKIKGPDIVILIDEKINFTQLKTIKDALSCSQTNRYKKYYKFMILPY
jgi:hypothetical protein